MRRFGEAAIAIRTPSAASWFDPAQPQQAELKRASGDPPNRSLINAKAKELADRVNALTESDPKRAAKINEELRDMEIKQTAEQLGSECEAYEKRIKHVEQAEKQAPIAPAEDR